MNLLFHKKKYLFLKLLKLSFSQGNKPVIDSLIKLSFSAIKKTKKQNPLRLLMLFINKSQPFCEVKTLKIKGTQQKIPVEIKQKQQKSLLFRWLLINAQRKENKFIEALAKELLESTFAQSQTTKNCDEMHKVADINKIFTQFKN